MVAMSADPPISEGFVSFRGHRTWYRVVGDRETAGKLPLILLNGGPGMPHDYFEPLAGPERFREAVGAFLDGVEGGAA
jgi:hypothetical protein